MDPTCSKNNVHIVKKPTAIEMKSFVNNKIEVRRDELTCPICLDTVRSAVETDCCGLLLCEDCAVPVQHRPCPHCRRGTRLYYKANMTIRRLLDHKLADDEEENNAVTKVYHCPSPSCSFSGQREDFIVHSRQIHLDMVRPEGQSEGQREGQSQGQRGYGDPEAEDPGYVVNELGRAARVGRNGKFYCGVWKQCTCCDQSGCKCACCRRRCGPDDGCNCGACMRLDLISRGLGPGYLVNNDGLICRYNYREPRTGQVHDHWNCLPDQNCRLAQKLALLDGLKQVQTLLSPCPSCAALQRQYKSGRYTRFMMRC